MIVFKIKKKYFTLLETMISLALVSILLSSLTYLYYEINLLDLRAEKSEKKAFQLRYLEDRLFQLIPHIISNKNKDFIFFSGSSCDHFNKPGNPYLLFSFDNSINLVDANFSNHVVGRIFLDKEGNLILAIVPSLDKVEFKDQIPISKEILFKNVKSLNFSFFSWSDSKEAGTYEFSPPKGEWVSYWKQEYHELPALLKMEITYLDLDKEKKRIMIFPLSNAKYKITYGSS